MKKPEYLTELYFLEFLLKSYFNDKFDFPKHIIDLEPLSAAIEAFISYYKLDEELNDSLQYEEIKKFFITQEIDGANCKEMGLCYKTYYRHKFRYIEKFKHFLSLQIGEFSVC